MLLSRTGTCRGQVRLHSLTLDVRARETPFSRRPLTSSQLLHHFTRCSTKAHVSLPIYCTLLFLAALRIFARRTSSAQLRCSMPKARQPARNQAQSQTKTNSSISYLLISHSAPISRVFSTAASLASFERQPAFLPSDSSFQTAASSRPHPMTSSRLLDCSRHQHSALHA